MEKKIPIKTLYLLLVISLGLVGLGVGSTYALFTTSAEISNPITLGSDLSYSSDIIEMVSVTVPASKTVSTTLNVNNSTSGTLNYVAWYIDEGYDIDVVCESGAPQGTVASGGSTSVIVNTRNYSDETITVNVGVSSNGDSVVLGSSMKQIEDVNFLMSVVETPSATSNFLSSSLTRNQISSITFVDNNTVPSGYTSADVSKYSDGSILMWYGSANSSGYYDVYIGSSSGITYIEDGWALFAYLSNCTSIYFNSLADTSMALRMNNMFRECSSLIDIDVNDFDVSNVSKMGSLFSGCISIISLDLSNWDTSNVTNMSYMFSFCSSLEEIDVSSWDTSSVTNMSYMFQVCFSLKTIDLSNWDVSKVTDMTGMFLTTADYGNGYMALTSIGDISNWNVSSVTSFMGMFQRCSGLKSLDLSGWNISSASNIRAMFSSCTGLEQLDLSGWNTSGITNMLSAFQYCSSLKTIYVSDKWTIASGADTRSMFLSCTSLVGGAGTVYNSSYTDGTYARIDGGTSSPGYFTSKV